LPGFYDPCKKSGFSLSATLRKPKKQLSIVWINSAGTVSTRTWDDEDVVEINS